MVPAGPCSSRRHWRGMNVPLSSGSGRPPPTSRLPPPWEPAAGLRVLPRWASLILLSRALAMTLDKPGWPPYLKVICSPLCRGTWPSHRCWGSGCGHLRGHFAAHHACRLEQFFPLLLSGGVRIARHPLQVSTPERPKLSHSYLDCLRL